MGQVDPVNCITCLILRFIQWLPGLGDTISEKHASCNNSLHYGTLQSEDMNFRKETVLRKKRQVRTMKLSKHTSWWVLSGELGNHAAAQGTAYLREIKVDCERVELVFDWSSNQTISLRWAVKLVDRETGHSGSDCTFHGARFNTNLMIGVVFDGEVEYSVVICLDVHFRIELSNLWNSNLYHQIDAETTGSRI